MSKEIYISSTPHETRLAIVENDALTEIYYERENEYTLAGSIYNGKVTRVLPGMQSSFVDIGLERDAFLYITDFMEDASESDEFDTSDATHTPRPEASGNRDRNAPRGGDRNRDRGERGDRAPRLPQPAAEPTDAELFSAAVSDVDPIAPASDRGERSDRGDRDRNRGRGGRNRGRDRDRRPEAPRPAAAAPVSDEPNSFMQPSATIDSDEVGEGAPGADGSRRWRGRRGRRGGRGPGFNPGREPNAAAPLAPEPDSVDLYAAEAPAAPVVETPRAPRAEQPRNEQTREAQAPRGDRNDRGPRNDRDRGGRNDRGGRDRDRGGRDGREPRAPRGFEPRTPFAEPEAPVYGREVYAEAPAEPIILPGESLSKYRPQTESTSTSSASTASSLTPLPPPSTEFKLADAWDGGFVLPGESLSRRRTESRPAPTRTPEPSASYAPPAPVSHLAAPLVESEPAHVPVEHVPATPAPEELIPELVETAPAAIAIEAAAPEEAPAAEPQVPQEYEPTEAAVSYRVDPVAPREYRQSAPVLEPVSTHAEHAQTEPDAEHTSGDVTTLEATGEMISHPLIEESAPVTHEIDPSARQHLEQVSAPILEEHAVVSAQLDAPTQAHTTSVPPPPFPSFAPGTGDLEEEELEDEEFEIPSLEARGTRTSPEDEDQEVLEGTADLGVMLREMSIDEITGPSDDDEDDLEEDFLEEDQELGYDTDDEEPAEDEFEDSDSEETEGDVDIELSGDENAAELSQSAPAAEGAPRTEPRREGFRREGRGRGRDRNRGRDRGGERSSEPRSDSRSEGRSEGRSDSGRRDGRGGRQSAQMTNLPAISDLLKPGQEILVQIAKEPIAKKGARITSHIALPGRFLVFMPTVSHTGVSRKIESDQERRRLKEILLSEKGDASGGFIVRTAAEGASEEELRSDLRFLLNLWADIKNRSESSKSPALIYHDLNLVERVLRDQVTDNFSAIWVDTESQYEQVLRFLQRFQPSLIRRVKLYTKETPLFEQFGITEEINKALRSKVWLKSGGSIVINQTEALVAIDINTGKYVGKTARLEDTIVKTNLDAIPEIVRQIRLRDLGGIIIIDFIDMDERKNRNRVMAALEEELKSDRAPSKVLQFNDFGLVAITRKRVKQSLERTLSTTCGICAGTGMVKSPITVCNDIYVEMRKMHKHLDRGDVMLRVHPDVVKQLKAGPTHWLQEMEEMCGKTILVKSDPSLHPEQFDIH